MLAGWAIALAAAMLLTTAPSQLAFIVTGIAIEILGFVFVVRTHLAPRGDRVD
jgi:hypothetical protein